MVWKVGDGLGSSCTKLHCREAELGSVPSVGRRSENWGRCHRYIGGSCARVFGDYRNICYPSYFSFRDIYENGTL